MKKQKLGIYSLSISHFIETILYWLSLDNEFEIILITYIEPEFPIEGSEHIWSLKRVKNLKNVLVCAYNSVPQKLDWLYIHLNNNNLRQHYCLKQWIQRSDKIGILSDTDYRSLKAVLKELHCHKSIIFRSNSCTFQVGSQSKIAYPFIKNRFFYTPSAHPQILWNQVLSEKIFSLFQPSIKQRLFKFIFIGNRNPPQRNSALQQIKQKLNYYDSLKYYREYNPQSCLSVSQKETLVLWIEYGDNGSARGIAPKDYIDTLGKSEFCICPPGWFRWTHRVIEALLKGAIPILENYEKDNYNIELQDMKNCILVENSEWDRAIDKAIKLNSCQILEMQKNILILCKQHLLPHSASENMKFKLGLK